MITSARSAAATERASRQESARAENEILTGCELMFGFFYCVLPLVPPLLLRVLHDAVESVLRIMPQPRTVRQRLGVPDDEGESRLQRPRGGQPGATEGLPAAQQAAADAGIRRRGGQAQNVRLLHPCRAGSRFPTALAASAFVSPRIILCSPRSPSKEFEALTSARGGCSRSTHTHAFLILRITCTCTARSLELSARIDIDR